jgi:hypothetical protein
MRKDPLRAANLEAFSRAAVSALTALGRLIVVVWLGRCMFVERMDQPLWQNYLNLGLIAFVARRAGVGLALSGAVVPLGLKSVYVSVLGVCILAGVGIWLKRRWVMTSIAAVALGFGVQTAAELALGAQLAAAWWLAMQLIAAWLWSALALFLAARAAPDSRSAHA